MTENKAEGRNDWVDYGKGVGIILVVYAHLLSSGYHAGLNIPERFFHLSDSTVYSFHMPLFFFLSGLFVENSLKKRGARSYILDKFLRIAYPYFIWSILQVSTEVIFSAQTQRGADIRDLSAIAYQPWGQFWFLYALLLMHLVYSVFNRFRIFLLIASLALFFYPLNTGIVALSGFSTHFLFFIGGMLLKNFFTSTELIRVPLWATLTLLVLFLGSCYYIFESYIEPVRLADRHYPLYFLYLSILGITNSIFVSQYLTRMRIFELVRIAGTYSLPIFLAHMLVGVATRMVLIHIFHIQNWIIHIVAGVTVGLIAPIVLYRISMQMGFRYIFETPTKFLAYASLQADD
jgi:fucose 4-O-acetylase-like acetyltransferase